jgi:signal transduction histidine kinase
LPPVRRIAVIFLVAVFVPSLVLGFLALRTAGEQRAILERQVADLYQTDADQLAAQLREALLGRQREFAERVRALLATVDARRLAIDFSRRIGRGAEGVAFVVAPDGNLTTTRANSPDAGRFLRENGAFLSNRAEAELFPTQQESFNSLRKANQLAHTPEPPGQRTVQPQRRAILPDAESNLSRLAPQVSDFETATAGGTDGVLARYNQNALELLLWTRPPEADGYVFGLAMSAKAVRAFVQETMTALAPSPRDACLAVLDENARPVAVSQPNFTADWARPFVASEVGELLPHWEVALYLLQPAQLAQSARLVTLTLVLLIAVALAAILAGGAFVAFDARRQLALAQRKTDFVSNVSHELKTPLTSIRMFAELLERVQDPDRRSHYLRIITLEADRLTRLINNVLDFARSDRRERVYHKADIDLHDVMEGVWEAHALHLEEAGFACERIEEDAPYPVHADADAVGQVLVNLLSNAEKYCGPGRAITLHSRREGDAVLVSVQDRGPGVPKGEEQRIFEAFHRAHDSLASGIQGTGLGLTLARNIARDHGGDIGYEHREGGGSTFTLRLPLRKTAHLSA